MVWKNGKLQVFHLRERGMQRVLGSLEADVMEILWKFERRTAREVMLELAHIRPLAFNTVMTILNRLCDKGLVGRKEEGVAQFSSLVSKAELQRHVTRDVSDSLLEEFGETAIAQFVDSVSRRDPELLEQLRRILKSTQDKP